MAKDPAQAAKDAAAKAFANDPARKAREALKKAWDEKNDPYGSLTGADRDAAVALTALFKTYGLETLAPQIIAMIQKGFSSDTIAIELQQTKEYKQRFAANEARIKAGLPALTPAEYVSTEQAYRQVMSAAGLPIGFYDSHDDFRKFLESDVSPTEIQARVGVVADAIYKAPAETTNYFKQWYNTGDMIAYALDPKVATPLIEQRIRAAESAALAAQNGLALTQSTSERIGRSGASLQDIQQGTSFIGAESKTTDKLNSLYGGSLNQDDLVAEVFENNATAAAKRKGLASRDRATFGNSGAQTKTSLGKESSV